MKNNVTNATETADKEKGSSKNRDRIVGLITTVVSIFIMLLVFLFGEGILNKPEAESVIHVNISSNLEDDEKPDVNAESPSADIEYPRYTEHPNVPDFGAIRGFVLAEPPDEIRTGDNTDFPMTMYLYAHKADQDMESELQKYADILTAKGFQHEGKYIPLALFETIDFENMAGDTILVHFFFLERYNNLQGDIVLCGEATALNTDSTFSTERLVVLVQDTTRPFEQNTAD
jgi:hypothetical protein